METERVGAGTRIWAHAHILPGATIGRDCNICDQTFIENDVVIWDGVTIEDGVFIGPGVAFTNDLFPRSKHYPDKYLRTKIDKGASIGANATLLPGITIGEHAMVGAGAVVTRDVPPNCVVVGNPARIARTFPADAEASVDSR